MKKLILTSPGFNGEVELLYGTDGMLVLIDMQNADLNAAQVRYLKTASPIFYEKDSFKAAFRSDTLVVTEGDYKVTFDMFYNEYGVKRNRDRCEKIWAKMSEVERVKAYAGIKPYKRHLTLNTWKTQADPENYLKKKFWLNDWR